MQILISQIEELYRSDDSARITKKQTEEWGQLCGMDRASIYDAVAAELAIGFHNGSLNFEFCDAVVNDLIAIHFEENDSLFWEVFLAFDAGEYLRYGDAGDPVDKYTRPLIAEIVSKFSK